MDMNKNIVNGYGGSGSAKEFRDIKITTKRQITIPKAFFDYLGIEDMVHAYLFDDGILIKPAQKRSVQEMDIETIVRNVMNEGYNGNAMADEIAHRIKKYNESMERRIGDFLDDMTSDEVPEDQGDEFNGLEMFFDQEDGETAEASEKKSS